MRTIALLALLVLAPATARAEPDLHVRPAVVVLPRHVSVATNADPEVYEAAKRLDQRRSSSIGIGIASFFAGGAISTAGVLMDGSCSEVAGAKTCEPNYRVVGVGAAVAALGVIVAIARNPVAADYRAVTEQWNARHPDEPIAVRD